jgi:hypothetical protein
MRLVLALALSSFASGCAPCADCFTVELSQAEDFGPCCTYERDNQGDPLLVRFTRLDGADYLAGVNVGCQWPEATAIQADAITRDGEAVDVSSGINLSFDADQTEVTLGINCRAKRPAPQYPITLLGLLDEDLQAQFGEQLVIEPIVD